MKIAFFGASVTQQNPGYVTEFHKLNQNYEIYQKGFGGMHLCDAGMIYINDIVKLKPIYCFIDWFSTGYLNINKESIKKYIDNIIFKLTEISCKIIFLFLPRTLFEKERFEMYKIAKEVLKENNISYIELDKQFDFICKINETIENDILRDNVHTTNKGGIEYAKIISNWFINNKNNIKFPNNIKKNYLYNIKKINLKEILQVNETLKIKGNCKEIFFNIKKGPWCGIVYFNDKKVNTWDRWCHYERNSIIKLNGFEKELNILISNETIDTSQCKDTNFNWNKYTKSLKIIGIYLIDGKIEL